MAPERDLTKHGAKGGAINRRDRLVIDLAALRVVRSGSGDYGWASRLGVRFGVRSDVQACEIASLVLILSLSKDEDAPPR